MSNDADKIATLLSIATDSNKLALARATAKEKLFQFDHEGSADPNRFPNGCAIMLSELLEEAGVDIEDTFMAKGLCNVLESRGWQRIAIGNQIAGDVGSTCQANLTPNDHVYLVVEVETTDKMKIVDNQRPVMHRRAASGTDLGEGAKTPTTFFLRA